jgi:hypothetical protein
MKLKSMLFFFLVNTVCFGYGIKQKEVVHERYSSNISKITEQAFNNMYKDATGYITTTIKEFTELKNGIYILTERSDDLSWREPINRRICYNINHNNAGNSEIRLIDLVWLGQNYELNYYDNRMEIQTTTRVFSMLDDNKRLEFEWDSENRLKFYKIINQDTNKIEVEYEYRYNNSGRLDSIYSVHEWGNVLRKSIYYDGQLRVLERPFFSDIGRVNLDEIIIFDNNKLKYHIKRYIRHGHPEGPDEADAIETREESNYYILYEFDNNGDEIKQTTYYFWSTSNYNWKKTEYLQYDNRGNWNRAKVITEDDVRKYTPGEYKREIEYK